MIREDGQSILEYSLIIAVLVLVIVSSIPSLRNSLLGVFNKTQQYLEGEIGEQEITLPETTQTVLGSNPLEITYNLAQLMIDYRKATGKNPPRLIWDNETNSWTNDDVAWETLLRWKYPDDEIDVEVWRRHNNVDGIIYSPHGNLISIEPHPDYQLQFNGTDGTAYTLQYHDRTGIGAILNISRSPEDQRWFAGMHDESGRYFEVPIDIESLQAFELDP